MKLIDWLPRRLRVEQQQQLCHDCTSGCAYHRAGSCVALGGPNKVVVLCIGDAARLGESTNYSMAEFQVADEYDDNTAGYLSQPIAFPASVLNRIASFLPLKDVRNLGACCTSAFVLCCDHIDRLTVRVPKTKRLQPLFRGFAKYANVTHVTGAPCEMTGRA